jgi:histidinol-phosphate/aromatic aminotransferase/cobyric acid decarboxylase-like protein/GTP:adenosylcobinamide-phosphate guanylyltransferase
MLEINGKPLIIHALENLHQVGIKKVIVVVGYKKDNLIKYVGDKYKDIDIEYVENPIYDKTNNIYSLYLARNKLMEDDTILLESDLLFEKAILEELLNDSRENLAVVDKYQIWMDGTSVRLDEDDNIIGFYTKKDFKFQDVRNYYKTVNIYKFSKNFSKKIYIPFLEAYMKAMGVNEYYETVIKVIANLEGTGLKALRLNGQKWYEIDDIQDKANAEIIFAPNPEIKLNLIKKRYGGYWRFPKLKDFCYLVNPYFPSEKMQEEIKAYFYELLSQYPSGQETQKLLAGKMFKIEPENIIVGNGAAELIRGLSKVINGTFGLAFPTFNEYPESIGYERVVKFIPKNKDFSYNIDDMTKLAKKCDNLILINPDNPSGNFIPKNELLKLADKLLEMGKTFILDESFVDFSTNGEEESMISQEILDKYPSLIIIKSISKSYGVPGIRLGILATSNKNIIKSIEKQIPIWNINSFGEFFMQIFGKYKKDYKLACEKISRERDRFYQRLQEIPYLRVIKSQANYFLIEIVDKYKATELTQKLLWEDEIFIKDLTGKIGFEGKEYIRIAVRDYNDNEFLIEKLKEWI